MKYALKKFFLQSDFAFETIGFRSMPVTVSMFDWDVRVHNGRKYYPLNLKDEMIGFNVGRFSFTRRVSRHLHSSKNKKMKNKNKK